MPTLRLLPRTTTIIPIPLRLPLRRHAPPALRTRPFSSSSSSSSTFQPGPSPPRLPAEQQAEFERLQRAVSDRIADPTPLPHEQQQQPPSSPSPASTSRHTSTPAPTSQGEELPTSVRKGAKPEFDGDTNPRTGEVGGPKNEPLRWGSGGDWSYNGRVTDF